MSFTDHLWNRISPIYQAILDHPFIRELAEGILAEDVFRFYMKQDALYLSDFSRALATTGVHSEQNTETKQFFEFANYAIDVERDLHKQFYEKIDVDMNIEKSPACLSYTNFLLATASTKGRSVSIAALLPCFWIYREVGMHNVENSAANNPYQNWIDMYAGDDFREGVEKAIDITNNAAVGKTEKQKQAMEKGFVRSSQLEWIFWDSAYRKEEWPQQPSD